MEKLVKTNKGNEIYVYTLAGRVHLCPKDRYNPKILNARNPVFEGNIDEAIAYVKKNW
jgi:hypothetical protein